MFVAFEVLDRNAANGPGNIANSLAGFFAETVPKPLHGDRKGLEGDHFLKRLDGRDIDARVVKSAKVSQNIAFDGFDAPRTKRLA